MAPARAGPASQGGAGHDTPPPPLVVERVPAGSPSPADDYVEGPLSLHDLVVWGAVTHCLRDYRAGGGPGRWAVRSHVGPPGAGWRATRWPLSS